MDEGKSLITIVEIFTGNDDKFTVAPFIVSFVPNRPFRVLSGASYLRRPNCELTKDFCSEGLMVTNCHENQVATKHNYVISNDLVYVIPRGFKAISCYPAKNSCCSYIKPNYEGGICPNILQDRLLGFDFEDEEEETKKYSK